MDIHQQLSLMENTINFFADKCQLFSKFKLISKQWPIIIFFLQIRFSYCYPLLLNEMEGTGYNDEAAAAAVLKSE